MLLCNCFYRFKIWDAENQGGTVMPRYTTHQTIRQISTYHFVISAIPPTTLHNTMSHQTPPYDTMLPQYIIPYHATSHSTHHPIEYHATIHTITLYHTMPHTPHYIPYHATHTTPHTIPCHIHHTIYHTMPHTPHHIPCHIHHTIYHTMPYTPHHISYHATHTTPCTIPCHTHHTMYHTMPHTPHHLPYHATHTITNFHITFYKINASFARSDWTNLIFSHSTEIRWLHFHFVLKYKDMNDVTKIWKILVIL